MLDESMSAWKPKTSKLGGLPNYTYEPRKPVPLGTMIRNGVECKTGILVFQDIVQNPEKQCQKEFVGTRSHMPRSELITASVAEVLRQAKNSNLEKGGWVGGDAWFGQVMSCIELVKRLGVFSTFIVKQNLLYFPAAAMKAVLIARFRDRPGGHWVVFKTVIAGVPVFALVYAWSHKGFAFMVSTCGSTMPHEHTYCSNYEDPYGNKNYKEFKRPSIAHFLFEYLPLIDEHNKGRMNILSIERNWPTKNCWFCLLTTMLGC